MTKVQEACIILIQYHASRSWQDMVPEVDTGEMQILVDTELILNANFQNPDRYVIYFGTKGKQDVA